MKCWQIVLICLFAIFTGVVIGWCFHQRVANPVVQNTPSTQSNQITEISASEKRAFLVLLGDLPTRGEFFADESIEQAAPYTRVLLAITEADVDQFADELGIKEYDLYRLLVLITDLSERKSQRDFVLRYFGDIRHPQLKLAWAVQLFDRNAATDEVLVFLRKAMASKPEKEWLSSSLGPGFGDFEKRLQSTPHIAK